MTRPLARLALVAGAVIALDRWTKHWAAATLPFNRPVEVLGEFVRLTYTRNSGVAFGLGQGSGFPFAIFSIVAAIVILVMFVRREVHGWARELALALIFGGAIGNLVDRLSSGEVVDFLEVGAGGWYWPVFNVADSAVSIGVVLFAFAWTRRPADGGAIESESGNGSVRDATDAEAAGPGVGERGAAGSLPGGGADRPLA